MSSERITELVENYDKQVKNIREDVLKMCWNMRGGVTYEEGMNLSLVEREMIGELIKENYETTKKSGLPHF